MSGGSIPYHLRPNKAVDRSLFVEYLRRVQRAKALDEHTYVGFGGPFLQDMEEFHRALPFRRLVSLESSSNVYARQKAHKTLRAVELEHMDSTSYISNSLPDDPLVFWLDYAEAAKVGVQIKEFEGLVSRLAEFDVVRVTVNANLSTLEPPDPPSKPSELADARFEKLVSRVDLDYLPHGASAAQLKREVYPLWLLHALRHAARRAVSNSTLVFNDGLATCYADGKHAMLTFAGVLLERGQISKFVKQSGLEQWRFYLKRTGVPVDIDMPTLTKREVGQLNKMLPRRRGKIGLRNCLGYRTAKSNKAQAKQLESYRQLYRYYPRFMRVVG